MCNIFSLNKFYACIQRTGVLALKLALRKTQFQWGCWGLYVPLPCLNPNTDETGGQCNYPLLSCPFFSAQTPHNISTDMKSQQDRYRSGIESMEGQQRGREHLSSVMQPFPIKNPPKTSRELTALSLSTWWMLVSDYSVFYTWCRQSISNRWQSAFLPGDNIRTVLILSCFQPIFTIFIQILV